MSRTPRPEIVTDGFVAGAPGTTVVIRTRRRPARSPANARARMSATSPLVTLSRRCRALAAASTSRAMSPFRSHFSEKFLARVSTVPDVDDERSRSSTMREPSEEVDETRDRRRGGDASGRVARDRGVA